MTFLQPILLAGLPLVALPILIHLINRWRHRKVEWGAMMFLLDAKRLTRGMAKLRFWLIMAMRMLAIAALLFAFARPLTSGWLGLAIGGQVETTIILLDRSASMEQTDLNSPSPKGKRHSHNCPQCWKTPGVVHDSC
ncbi:MAG: BatA domain-containing protein [Planctomycetaceae bacterium]